MIVLGSPFVLAGAAALLMQWWLGGVGVSVSWALAAAGAAAVLAALDDLARARHLGGERTTVAAVAGVTACAVLLLAGGAEVLRFRLIAREAGELVELPGAGVVLGVMLLSALGGTLVLAADRLAPGASALAPVVARGALILAAALGVIAVGLIAKAALAGDAVGPFASVGAGLLGATCLLAAGSAATLVERLPGAEAAEAAEARAARLIRLAAALAVASLLAAVFEAWSQQASYLAGSTRAALVTALAGFAASQPTGFRLLRALVFAGLIVSVVVRGA